MLIRTDYLGAIKSEVNKNIVGWAAVFFATRHYFC
jgi:hypothetical protein